MQTNSMLTFRPGLKDFLTSCLFQFKVYIWSVAPCYNIDKHLDEIKEKENISLDPSKVLGQELCQKNDHFLPNHLEKPIFHKKLNVFFLKFPDTHVGNILFIDDTPYKCIFNDLCSAIFLELFEGAHRDGDYLFSTIIP
jgi:hypothetical protein